ncbi:MAG: hypothetical protein AAGI07_18035 [Bacteroidota bacterium]
MKTFRETFILRSFYYLLLSILLFVNCTEKTDGILPIVEDEGKLTDVIQIAEIPELSEAPKTESDQETTKGLFFPEEDLSDARTAAYGTTNYVDFNDQMALSIIPDNAKNTFTYWPFYIQKVGNAWVHVKENNELKYREAFRSNYQHYHLGYENFEPCVDQNFNFKKPVGNNCINFDPTLEPRKLSTHYGDHWIKVYAYDYDSPSRVFDLLEIEVTKGPIQLWFKKSEGGWYNWSSLGVGRWNLSNYCIEITEVLISGIDHSSVGFDDLKIKVPY